MNDVGSNSDAVWIFVAFMAFITIIVVVFLKRG
jgi:hypothetical protein